MKDVSLSNIKLPLLSKVIWNYIRKFCKIKGVFSSNTSSIPFKYGHAEGREEEKKKIDKHQSFISAQFSPFGQQSISYCKLLKHSNCRQLDRPFKQVSPNRDSNQISHDEFHSQSRTGYRAGQITAHYRLEINFQPEGLWRTVHQPGTGVGKFNSLSNRTKCDPLSKKRPIISPNINNVSSRKYTVLEGKYMHIELHLNLIWPY